MLRLSVALLLFTAFPESGSVASLFRDAQARNSVSVPTGSISGRVTDRETGQPLARVAVTLGGPAVGPLKGRPLVTHADADGRYAFTQLARGPYSLTFAPPAYRATHLAHVYGERRPLIPRFRRPYPISLRSGQRLDHADVALWRAFAISGRVSCSRSRRPRGSLGRFASKAAWILCPPASTSDRRGIVKEDLRFELSGLFGPQLITVTGLPRNYYVKRVKYGTEDITDTPFDFKGAGTPQALEILLSNRGAFLTGIVLDDQGNRADDTVVLAFSADRTRWRTAAAVAVRLLVPPPGPYTAGPLRPGDYFVVAVSGEDREACAGEPEMLEELSRSAERVLLVEGERRPLDLRVLATRDGRD